MRWRSNNLHKFATVWIKFAEQYVINIINRESAADLQPHQAPPKMQGKFNA